MFSNLFKKSEVQLIIKWYNETPVNNFEMDDACIMLDEWNIICWDNLKVYLKINNNILTDFSFAWDPSMVTKAAASLLAELIEWKTIDEIMKLWLNFMKENWFNVSARRDRSAVLPLVAVQNAIYKFLWEDKKVEIEDLLLI
jgi:NifU-like protein involved in Fe-S cluster formation